MDSPLCKECASQSTRRVLAEGYLGRLASIFAVHPFRCQSCYALFYKFNPRGGKDQIDRRHLDRIAVDLEAVISTIDKEHFPAQVTDLSPAGCKCLCMRVLETNRDFDLSITLVENESPIHALVEIVRVDGTDQYGMKFIGMGEMEWYMIRHYLNR